jgi:hypothetical protein
VKQSNYQPNQPLIASRIGARALAILSLICIPSFAQQTPFFSPGNLVVVVEGCGAHGGTCTSVPKGTGNGTLNSSVGGYGDNQAGPLTLFQYTPNGTASATYVNSLVLPQNASGANLPVSGEYGSSSEGTLQLSGAGQYLTLMGYGINAATFDAAYYTGFSADPYGAAPSGALAQSGSLVGQSYTPVPRVLALIDANGNVNSATSIFNIFNTNNPRSVFTLNGTSAYVSGQGSGSDATGGVFYLPSLFTSITAPVAITGLDTSSKTISQDTRDVTIYNNTLYISVDSKEGSGSNRDFIGTLGTPPATTLFNSSNGPAQLTGFGTSTAGKLTLTATNGNNLNASQKINLSPSNYFFANATTLYVADSGAPKNDSNGDTNASGTANIGNGGLQKWVNVSGTWTLVYTLYQGLNLVNNGNTNGPGGVPSGTSGLYGLTGVVNGSTVSLYATNYTLNDLDQTYLYGITDTLANTTPPGASLAFTLLDTAPKDSNFKGVSFAPTIPNGDVEVLTSPSGLSFTSAGSGCAPGTYPAPLTLTWTPSSSCQLSVASPQTGATGVQYVFSQWDDGTTMTTRTVSAPATTAAYTANFTTQYQLTTTAGTGGMVSQGGYYAAGTYATITATPNTGYTFVNFTGATTSTTNPLSLLMNGPQSITANFALLPPPAISNLKVVTVGGNSATITWNTDQPSSSQVNYGLTSAYGSSSPLNASLQTSHSVTISGLTPNTTYYFDVASTNSANETSTASSATSTFTTTPYVGYVAFWGVNNSGVTISWSTDTPSNTMLAYGSNGLNQFSPVQPALTTSHGVVLTGLSSGTTYSFQSLSTDANGNIGGSAIYTFTTTGVGTSPAPVISNVVVSGITMTSATITWNTDQASTSLVNYGISTSYGSSSPLNSNLATAHSVTLTGLTPGTTYDFDVMSANGSGTAIGTSTNYTFSTLASNSTPPVITNIATTGITSSSVTITWTTDQPSWSQVNYGATTVYGFSSPLDTTLVTSHSVTLAGLAASTAYDFDVSSTNAGGASSASTNQTFTTLASSGTPPYVGYVAFWGINNSGVTISWSTDLPANTVLVYGTSPSFGQTYTDSTLTVSHGVVLTTLNPGTTYYFQAQSTGTNGATGMSTTYSFTTTGVASAALVISNVAYSNVTGTSATITWSTDQPSSSQVNYGTTTGYGFSSPLNSTLVTSHSVTLTGLLAGTIYDFEVVSANAASTSATSANNSFTTASAAPPVISNVAFSNVTSSSATITWTTDQASGSLVNYGITSAYGAASTPNNTPVTSHSVTITGLLANTTYDFDVVSGATTSGNYTFTTSVASASAPQVSYVAFWGITSSGVTISWSTNVPANTSVAYGTTNALAARGISNSFSGSGA